MYILVINDSFPKTFFLVNDKKHYFAPKIQYEIVDNSEKNDNISELYIRGWKIGEDIMNVFEHTMPFAEKLTLIKLFIILFFLLK